jgi:PAT family beta-lactamase induction signal transducer AmpG
MSVRARVEPAYLALFASLYALQGVVVAYFINFNQLYMEAAGVAPATVGTVQSLALVPLILKFLGGPISDRINLLGLGHRQPYIVLGLILQTFGLIGLAWINPGEHLGIFTIVAVVTVTGLALYDTCCDGMVIDVTPPHDRSRIQGTLVAARSLATMVFSYLFGRMLAGGGFGLDPGRYHRLLWTCACLGVIPLVLALLVREPQRAADAERFQWAALRVLITPRALVLLAFGAAYALVSYGVEINLSPYYHALRISDPTIGTLASIRYIGRAVGAALVPLAMSRLGRRWVLGLGIAGLAASTAGQAMVAGTASAGFWGFVFGAANGWDDAVFYVLAMEASDPRMAASTYALFMAVSNVSVAGGGLFAQANRMLGGGYTTTFLLSGLLALTAWPLIPPLARRPLSGSGARPSPEPQDVLA